MKRLNLFVSMLLLSSALFVSCSNDDNAVEPINNDPVPEQPGDDQPGETAYLECPDGNHPHMIDLGLPSGTKWACCNVGASTPEEYGSYFAWGETEEKESYSKENYAYWESIEPLNPVDIGTDISGTQYDVAYVRWGTSWCMPTYEQCVELEDNVIVEIERNTTGKIIKLIGPNGGYIYIPAAGNVSDDEHRSIGYGSAIWTSKVEEYQRLNAMIMSFSVYGGKGISSNARDCGLSVRPVRR